MASIYRSLQWMAHEKPVIYWSLLLGAAGPIMVIAVPPIRARMGYKRPERVPLSYPVPDRPRRAVQGYEDP